MAKEYPSFIKLIYDYPLIRVVCLSKHKINLMEVLTFISYIIPITSEFFLKLFQTDF